MSLKFGVQVRISDDIKDLAKQFPRAAQAVLNRAAMESKKVAAKTTAAEYNVPEKVLKGRISVIKSTMLKLVAIVRFSSKGFNPYYFLKSKEPTTRRQPVILEIKKGSSIFVGNKFFTNIGRKSNMLKILRQPGENRQQLAPMPYLKANRIFDIAKVESAIRNFVESYMRRELPRVIEAWFKSGRAVE